MVLCCGVCWKSTAIIGIFINFTEKESCLLASLDLYSKQSVSDDKFYRRIYSEPLTSCKGKIGWVTRKTIEAGWAGGGGLGICLEN